jgi:excinuclease ABC subunit C
VKGLFAGQMFESFGPNRLGPITATDNPHRVAAPKPAALKSLVRRDCPRTPGVYGMLNQHEQLIYVGKAKSLRSRLLSYFRSRSRDPRARRIIVHTRAVIWERASSEFAALLRELELIQRFRPRFNVRGQPERRRLAYVCLGRPPARYIYLSASAPSRSHWYGPVRAGWRAREAVRHLNDLFQLRDCPKTVPMLFAGEVNLFPAGQDAGCLRYELKTCLGPCLAACSRGAYQQQEERARAFLEGRDWGLLSALEARMISASSSFNFEKAATLRDKLVHLRWLHDRLARIRRACERSPFLYRVTGQDGSQVWYLIQRGAVTTAFHPKESTDESRLGAGKLRQVARNHRLPARLPVQFMDGVYLVAGWFRRHPEERRDILSLSKAICSLP